MEQNLVTGIKTVLIPINKTGYNFMPFNDELEDKIIRYIDIVTPGALPESSADVFSALDNATMSLSNVNGNSYVSYEVPLVRYNPEENLGVRIPINKKISFQNSYINIKDNAVAESYAVLVVYYDAMAFAQVNTTNDLAVESFEVSIHNTTFRNMLPDNRTLVHRRFKQIAIPTGVTITPSFATCGNELALEYAYITLIKDNYLIFDNVPLMLFKEPYYLRSLNLRNITFDFINSYITIGGAGQNGVANTLIDKSIFFNILYENN